MRWAKLRETPNTKLVKALRMMAFGVQAANPELAGLLDHLAPNPDPDPAVIRPFVDELGAAMDGGTAGFELFEEAHARSSEVARGSSSQTTPDDVAFLMTSLVGAVGEGGGVVVDPACGIGGLLLMAAVTGSSPDDGVRFVGVDINERAARHSRARFFLYDIAAEIVLADSLRRDPSDWPVADVVVCDPPYGLNNWGDADLYRSPVWAYGAPGPHSADLAWPQLALSMLKPGGPAAICLPVSSCSRSGREQEVRAAMLRAGVVKSVIHLPARLRRDTSIPLVIWVLTNSPTAAPGPVLIVDATSLGTAGRSVHELGADAVERIREVAGAWRTAASCGMTT